MFHYNDIIIIIINRHVHINFVGNDIHNIVIVPSEIPLISGFMLPQYVPFMISAFDLEENHIQITLNISLSKLWKDCGRC